MDTASGLDHDPRRLKKARNLRRVGVLALAGLLLFGLSGALDPSEREVSAAGGGIDLEVSYPDRVRGGIDSPLEVRVSRAGGFTQPVQVTISRDWLDVFEVTGIEPEPAEATSDADRLIWGFDPPPGELLEVSLELITRPAVRGGQTGRLAVLDPEGGEVASVALETTVIP